MSASASATATAESATAERAPTQRAQENIFRVRSFLRARCRSADALARCLVGKGIVGRRLQQLPGRDEQGDKVGPPPRHHRATNGPTTPSLPPSAPTELGQPTDSQGVNTNIQTDLTNEGDPSGDVVAADLQASAGLVPHRQRARREG